MSNDEPRPSKEAPAPAPSPSEEQLRIMNDYANDLRETLKKFRKLLHS